MAMPYLIKFRVNRAHYEQLKEDALACGFEFVSAYIRQRVRYSSLLTESFLKENNTILKLIAERLDIELIEGVHINKDPFARPWKRKKIKTPHKENKY